MNVNYAIGLSSMRLSIGVVCVDNPIWYPYRNPRNNADRFINLLLASHLISTLEHSSSPSITLVRDGRFITAQNGLSQSLNRQDP